MDRYQLLITEEEQGDLRAAIRSQIKGLEAEVKRLETLYDALSHVKRYEEPTNAEAD